MIEPLSWEITGLYKELMTKTLTATLESLKSACHGNLKGWNLHDGLTGETKEGK
jgi:hypothetical protein